MMKTPTTFPIRGRLASLGIWLGITLLACSAEPVRAATHRLTPLESSLFKLMSKDAAQGRTKMKLDPILCKVARERAKDMAMHDYFSHTDQAGRGPNWKVRRAGYHLPAYYSSARDGNNIESIAMTTGDASSVFELWKDSPGHRPHVLGTDPFYKSQKSIGVGAYQANDAWGQIYYVFLSAPPNASPDPPRIILKNPAGKFVASSLGKSNKR